MLEQLFITINSWMLGGYTLAILGCFLWGVMSVMLSPCHLASIPLIIGYVGGQKRLLTGREAAGYALLFSSGLFITVAIVGVICAALGRILGDVGSYWGIGLGGILLWVGFGMFKPAKCSRSSGFLTKIRITGGLGAFVLGLAYGVLSGVCTFGYIAPILAVVTVQQQLVHGFALLLFFALGHCLPIAIAGSSTVLVERFIASDSLRQGTQMFRTVAGLLLMCLGIYFVLQPFID